MWGVARWMGAPLFGVGLLAGAVALVRDEPGVLGAGVLALVVVLIASLAGLCVLSTAGERPAGSWGAVLLIAQGVRMIGGLAIALFAFFAARPEPMVFWMIFLAASMAVLAGEVSFVIRWIRSQTRRTPEEPA
ncbi:MAG: hypothetical protein DYG94_13010 [Leptolyngbya sp. PLA3]|nr:MAG: hypothetical protein EDM82_03185 [Cyanobacteria bacterium CYA]MCE7969645.1 hypothetical protein [Leptolyngbya sp. PL-A3]